MERNAVTNGMETPLMCAVRSGSIDCLALLLNSGLNPFHLNALGQDVLTLANVLHPTGFMTSCIEQAIE